ncbi:MAG: sensor histidine kinase [Bacteroidetes bacterium]|nr:MAG: sensor histidine kinase [Bacteroidota bacterium]
MKSFYRNLILFLAVWLLSNSISAQSYFEVRLSQNTELQSNQISEVVHHAAGNYFIGSKVGIEVFDGFHLIHLKHIPHQPVVRIFEVGDSILVIQNRQIHLLHAITFEGRSMVFSDTLNFVLHDAAYLPDHSVLAVGEPGVYRIYLNNFQLEDCYRHRLDRGAEMLVAYANSIEPYTGASSIYIAFRYGLGEFLVNENRLVLEEDNPSNRLLADTRRLKPIGRKQGSPLFRDGRSGAIYQYDRIKDTLRSVSSGATRYGYFSGKSLYLWQGEYVYRLAEKTTDSFYFGSLPSLHHINETGEEEFILSGNHGLSIWKKSNPLVQEIGYKDSKSLTNPSRQSVYETEEAFFFSHKWGMLKLEKSTGKRVLLDSKANGVITALGASIWNTDTLLVYGTGGYTGFSISQERYIPLRIFSDSIENLVKTVRINAIHVDRKNGFLVMGLFHHPLLTKDLTKGAENFFNGNDKGWFRTVRCITQTGPFTYWLGANGSDGLMKVDFSNNSGHGISSEQFYRAGCSRAVVQSILPFEGKYMVNTQAGVLLLDPLSDSLIKVNGDDFVINDNVLNAAVVGGKFYFATYNKLYRLESGKAVVVHAFQGVHSPGIPFLWNKELHLLTSGAQYAYPENQADYSNSIRLSFIRWKEEWQDAGARSQIQLAYSNGGLELYFGIRAPYPDDASCKVFYSLDGQQFQLAPDQRLLFENLSPGKHQLRYYAMLNGRKTAEQEQLLMVAFPWYAKWWFVLLCALVLVAVIALIIRWRLHQQLEAKRNELRVILESVEQERERVSQDFHDAIGPNLSTIKLMGESLKRYPENEKLPPIGQVIDETIAEFRLILQELSPEIIRNQGLCAALDKLIEMHRKNHPELVWEVKCLPAGRRFPEFIENNFYRIAQEALNNALKYASANKITLKLELDGKELKMHISDNGLGFASDKLQGFGLQNMRSRAEVMRGKINIQSEVNAGTTVDVFVNLAT